MDQDRYGARPRWQRLLLGLPPAALLVVLGGYWTLLSWGVIGDERSETFAIIGPIFAGFGVALGWVVLQRRS
ncbi:hypothetical protein [Nocardioides humi]|uniref:Uncharacterized protein n=1 Tax=Nocardioides humi TaxID=449461 RepID=A0ABN2BWQ0_9ACTN|nr:hypothetical protein [Nocardioides humi]